jgi:hypothetical protein
MKNLVMSKPFQMIHTVRVFVKVASSSSSGIVRIVPNNHKFAYDLLTFLQAMTPRFVALSVTYFQTDTDINI